MSTRHAMDLSSYGITEARWAVLTVSRLVAANGFAHVYSAKLLTRWPRMVIGAAP